MSKGRTQYRIPLTVAAGSTGKWLADSARWDGFDFRPGDIVISAPSKSGTTWTQMICALLVFQTPELPAPLSTLSPWLDMRVRPVDDVHQQLDDQDHRRFIKTHTPLDGLPADNRVTYVAVGRDPREVAMSLHHHRANLDRNAVLGKLEEPDPDGSDQRPVDTPDERDTFRRWVDHDESPLDDPYSLRALVSHQHEAWSRRNDPNVVLLHYKDLSADLEGEMRRLAGRLGIHVPEKIWPELVAAASFNRMRERSGELVPDEGLGLFSDPNQFFRSGSSGGWRERLTDEDLARYEKRLETLASPELVQWLHHGGTDTGHLGRGAS